MGSFNYGELAANAAKGFEPLPVGEYDVEVTGAEFKQASTGSPMYKVEFTIETGPHKGRKVWRNLTLKIENPNAVGAFFGQMRALGLDAEFFATLPAENAEDHVCQALVGRSARVTVKHREWNGQTQNDVDRIVARTGVPVAAVAPSSVRSAAPALPPGL